MCVAVLVNGCGPPFRGSVIPGSMHPTRELIMVGWREMNPEWRTPGMAGRYRVNNLVANGGCSQLCLLLCCVPHEVSKGTNLGTFGTKVTKLSI